MATITNTNYFSPTQIVGCSLWLDAADTSRMTLVGSNISQYIDKSSNGIILSNATSANQPTLILDSNNMPNMLFNGTSQFLVNSAIAASNLTLSNEVTIFFIHTPSNSTNSLICWANYSGGAFRINFHTPEGTTGFKFDYAQSGAPPGGGRVETSIANYLTSGRRLDGGYKRGTSQVIRAYGSPVASVTNVLTITGSTSLPLALGSFFNLGYYYGGRFCELVWFNRGLNDNEINQIEGYLAWKWGTQASLPNTHPYFYNPMIPNLILPAPLANPLTTTNTTLITMNPTQIAGCALWLDAADRASITESGGVVSQWNDKSGNGRHMSQTTAINQPRILTNALNSLPVVVIKNDASTINFMSSLTTFPVNGLTNISIFVVANNTADFGLSDSTQNPLIWWNENGGWGQVAVGFSKTIYRWRFGTGQSANNPNASFPSNIGSSYILTNVAKSGVTETPYYNGSALTPFTAANAAIANTSGTTFYLGVGQNLNNYGPYNVAEVLVFTSALSTSQRQQIEGYLAWKWGLQASLPANHPYFYNPLIPNLILPSQIYTLSPSFSPSRFSGLGLWLDAADTASVVTSGSSVTRWNDKSGSNNNSTGVTGTVTFNSNVLNFGGSVNSSYISIPSISFSTTNMTFFIYLKFTSTFTYPTDANFYYLNFFTATGATPMFYGMVRFNTSPYNWIVDNYTNGGVANGQGVFYTGAGGPTGNSYIFTIVTNGSTYTQYQNGNLINTTNSTSFVPTTPASFTIGNGGNNMNIGEIVFFQNTTLITNQRQQIEGYLAWKWGLQSNLPSTHPYAFSPPS